MRKAYVPGEVRLPGRGTATNPPNRFERLRYEVDADDAPAAPDLEAPALRTEFFRDATRKILATNDSPDIPFDVSLNPYRGCEHGCAYCYARPTHEYLGFSAGLDFESKILVKEDAPDLLRTELARNGWRPQTVALSGVTDPYQPAERRLRLTRRCLEVFLAFRNPVGLITKSDLVVRLNDPDFFSRMRGEGAIAEQIGALFRVAARKAGLAERAPELSAESFRVPAGPQLSLFP